MMPPMATSSAKRKWSESFGDPDDKQSILDLCSSKLRYVNPARPPRRRTEVPLLRNVLIVNTMKHLSAEIKMENKVEYSEDLSVDPGHFEGLPPLSELLTDIMLDPQPMIEQQQPSFGWATSVPQPYPNLTPLEPSISSYMDTGDSIVESTEESEKIVHDLLPCTSVIDMDSAQLSSPWDTHNLTRHLDNSWQVHNTSMHNSSMPWNTSIDNSVLDCFLSSASLQHSTSDSLDSLASDMAFQTSSTPLPSFNSLFESHSHNFFTDTASTSSQSSSTLQAHSSATNQSNFSTMSTSSNDDLLGSLHLSESELEILLAMTMSSKQMLLEDLVQALPLQQSSPPSHLYNVPSSLQNSSAASSDNTHTSSNQRSNYCRNDQQPPSSPRSSYCRNDQQPPSKDDNGLVRVLVNL